MSIAYLKSGLYPKGKFMAVLLIFLDFDLFLCSNIPVNLFLSGFHERKIKTGSIGTFIESEMITYVILQQIADGLKGTSSNYW